MFEDKALIRFKSGAYTKYVSILNRIAMQLNIIKSMRIPVWFNAVIGHMREPLEGF